MRKRAMQTLALGMAFMACTAFTACGGAQSNNSGASPASNASGSTAAPTASSDASGSTAAPAASNEKIYIGISCGITGPVPLEGQSTVRGAELARDEINAAGGIKGRMVELVVEDDQSTANIAANVANKHANDDRVIAVLGPTRSANVMAVEQTMMDAGMPFLSAATSPKLVNEIDNPYFFRARCSDTFIGEGMAKYVLEELGLQKIAILYNNDDYGTGGKDVVLNYMKSKNVEPVVMEGHNTDDKDLSSAVTRCRDAGAEFIVLYTHPPEAAIFMRQLREMGINTPVIGPNTMSLPAFLSLVTPDESTNVFSVADYVANNPSEAAKTFLEVYQAKYNEVPDQFAAVYYTTVMAIADALDRADSIDRASLQKELLETKDLTTVMGVWSANENGEMMHSAVVAEIVDNTPVYISTVK